MNGAGDMREYFTVSELNDYIGSLLENDLTLADCWIKAKYLVVKYISNRGICILV
jgi:exonuclease VII large subunit